jgi:hypothetical protein
MTWGQPFHATGRVLRTDSAPALASCGEGKIDMAYVVVGRLVAHRQLDIQPGSLAPGTAGATMHPQTVLPARFSGSAELACSGHGQVELVARGGNDRLWHNRLLRSGVPVQMADGRMIPAGWQGWREVTQRFFGTLAMPRPAGRLAIVATRTGQMHLAVRDRVRNRVFHDGYDSGRYFGSDGRAIHWRGLERVSRTPFEGRPALAVSGRHLELALVGRDTDLWRASLPGRHVPRLRPAPGTAVQSFVDPVVLSSGPGIVDILFLEPNGRIRHIRRENERSGLEQLVPAPASGPVASVTAVPFGGAQIEVVARNVAGALYHWRYLRPLWGSPSQLLAPPVAVASVPVLIGTGAGDVLVLAIGVDRRLYRWRFAGGGWDGPRMLTIPLALAPTQFGPGVVSSGGDGVVDLALVESDTGRLFHARMHGEHPAASEAYSRLTALTDLGFRTDGVPTISSLGPERLNLVALGTDRRLHWAAAQVLRAGPGVTLIPETPVPEVEPRPGPGDRVLPIQLQWGGFRPITAPETGILVGDVVPRGDGELVVAAVGLDGQVYLGKLLESRWSVLAPLLGQTMRLQHRPPYKPSMVAH